MRQAIAVIANATFVGLPDHIWAEITTVSAFVAKKFVAWDYNLLTEGHARYGGRGIMIC